MSRTDLDVDNVFREKKIDAMKRRHFRGEELFDRGLRIRQDATDKRLFIVPSITQLGDTYRVRLLTVNQHACDLYCDVYEACVHEYSCDCPDGLKSNFCKHMHVVCLNIHTFDTGSGNDSNNLDGDNRNLGNNDRKKSIREHAKEALTELVEKVNQFTSNETFREIIQAVQDLKNKIETIEREEREGRNRRFSPQIDPCD